jgi:hypothetical protein
VAIDDGALADRLLAADSLEREYDVLARYSALVTVTTERSLDAAAADARLRSLTEQQQVGQRASLGAVLRALLERLGQWLYGLAGRPDPAVLLNLQAVVGLLVAIAIVVLIVRGTRERIRRETALVSVPGEPHADPAVHLRTADEALHGGRPRDAIHSLYLYAFAALAAREALRYDPALTDHELLRRATQLPHADALRDLVQLHEHVWFGLRDARDPDVVQARALAVEAVA